MNIDFKTLRSSGQSIRSSSESLRSRIQDLGYLRVFEDDDVVNDAALLVHSDQHQAIKCSHSAILRVKPRSRG